MPFRCWMREMSIRHHDAFKAATMYQTSDAVAATVRTVFHAVHVRR
jgi:hypothetical protein